MQELKAKVLAEMHRPAALGNVSFVSPDVQCPKKPKGRKPRKTTEKAEKTATAVPPRPSAAACGFSTVGMSDKDVYEKLKQTYGDEAGSSGKDTKKRSSSAGKKLEDSKQVEQDAELGTKKRGKSKSSSQQVEHGSKDEIEAPEAPPVQAKKRRRKGNKGKRAHEEEPAASSKRTRKEPKDRSRKSNRNEATQAEMEEAKRLEDIAARKARTSRKSSAYHKAVLAAKKNGASKEEQVAAGKAVS